jgi:hypothetical protein
MRTRHHAEDKNADGASCSRGLIENFRFALMLHQWIKEIDDLVAPFYRKLQRCQSGSQGRSGIKQAACPS